MPVAHQNQSILIVTEVAWVQMPLGKLPDAQTSKNEQGKCPPICTDPQDSLNSAQPLGLRPHKGSVWGSSLQYTKHFHLLSSDPAAAF